MRLPAFHESENGEEGDFQRRPSRVVVLSPTSPCELLLPRRFDCLDHVGGRPRCRRLDRGKPAGLCASADFHRHSPAQVKPRGVAWRIVARPRSMGWVRM